MSASDVRVLRADADQARLAIEAAGITVHGSLPTPSGTMVTIVTQGATRQTLEDLLEADGIDAYSIVTITP